MDLDLVCICGHSYINHNCTAYNTKCMKTISYRFDNRFDIHCRCAEFKLDNFAYVQKVQEEREQQSARS